MSPLRGLVPLLLLAACSDPDGSKLYTESGRNLLARTPDMVLEQVGTLVPDPEDQWGPYGRDGWRVRTESADGDRAFVWCKLPVARLVLPALEPEDRVLEIEMWVPPDVVAGPGEIAAEVRLNGFTVDEVALKAWPVRHRIEVRAPAWALGDNLLEVEPAEFWKPSEGEELSVAVSSVTYAPARLVDLDHVAGTARLEGGTGLRFRVEPLGEGTRLGLRGAAEDEGILEVTLSLLDPETGSLEEATSFALPIEHGRLEAELPFPPAGEQIVEVQLIWRSGPGQGPLTLEEAVLREPSAARRPPVVFISIDTLASRNMSAYGYRRNTTPNIEAFASDAVKFTAARTNAPFTLQSYMSQFVGLYPTANSLDFKKIEGRQPSPWEKDRLAPNRWTLAEMMRAAGYRTAAWVDNPWLARGFGFAQGFDHYDTGAAEITNQTPRGGIEHIFPRVRDWLGSLPQGEPSFVLIQALDPHGPYLPGEPFRDRFLGDEHYSADMRRVGREQLHAFFVVPDYIARGESPEGELPLQMDAGLLCARYDEKILQTDAVVGEILDWLKAAGLYEDSVIILSADHGESMLTHHFYFDHGTLYDEVLKVPLIIRLPGGRDAGRVVDAPVQLVDLMPTIADLIGVPRRDYLHGRSLVPLLAGEAQPEAPVFSEGGIMRQSSVLQGDWKLIEFSPRHGSLQTQVTHPRLGGEQVIRVFPELGARFRTVPELTEFFDQRWYFKDLMGDILEGPFHELYHVGEDPLEQRDLALEMPEKVAELRALMEGLRGRGEEAKKNADNVTTPMTMDAEQIAELARLGYVDAGED